MKLLNISEVLELAKTKLLEADKEEYLVDAEWILTDILEVNRTHLQLYPKVELSEAQYDKFMSFLERRLTGEPIQYILGNQSFYGYELFVDKRVLIPRFETEELVEIAVSLIKSTRMTKIMDLCSGSGCIGLATLMECSDTICTFVDLSSDALEVVDINRKKLGVAERSILVQGDLFENVADCDYDMILSNPPYIRKEIVGTLSEEVSGYEPIMALDGGDDGLDFYRRIANESQRYLTDNGILMMEIGHDQMEDVLELMNLNGYVDVKGYKDLSGNDRIVVGFKRS